MKAILAKLIQKKRVYLAIFGLLGLLTASGNMSYFVPDVNAGYGRCAKCYCKGYEGYSNQCSNCGHSFSDHY